MAFRLHLVPVHTSIDFFRLQFVTFGASIVAILLSFVSLAVFGLILVVESAILEHPAVGEAAVVGKPDALRGHIVKAFVVLRPGVTAAPSLRDEIVDLVKRRVGRHQYPREIEVVPELPKTETGKIQRFLLRKD